MYSSFAAVYDLLMSDADYEKRAATAEKLFRKYDRMPALLLDLACGTGRFSEYFADRGVSVIGVDISEEMLSVALSGRKDRDILYLRQDMTALDLYGTVDGAICFLDSLNHLKDYNAFCTALKKTALFLERDRLFIFDVNTTYKHKRVLGNNTFIKSDENVFCVWQNAYKAETCTVGITLDFFTAKGAVYERSRDFFSETAYPVYKVKAALEKAGFSVEAVLDGDTAREPRPKSERLLFVARRL